MRLKSCLAGNAVGSVSTFVCLLLVAPPSWGQQPGSLSALNAQVRAEVLHIVKSQHSKSFQAFQKNPAEITFTQAKEGIRPNITQAEFNAVVSQTTQFYKDLKVVVTIQIPTPDKSGVLSFDCVPENLQPALAPPGVRGNISYASATAPVDPDRPTLPPSLGSRLLPNPQSRRWFSAQRVASEN